MTKKRQIGKNSPKWLKALKLGSKGFHVVPDGSRSQSAWARTTRGTYARALYAFMALGQGPKGLELVNDKNNHTLIQMILGQSQRYQLSMRSSKYSSNPRLVGCKCHIFG